MKDRTRVPILTFYFRNMQFMKYITKHQKSTHAPILDSAHISPDVTEPMVTIRSPFCGSNTI